MYEVHCLRCEFSAEAPTLGRVFRLEEEHKAETGERHLLEWTEGERSAVSEPLEADGAGGGRSEGDSDRLA